MLSKKKFKSKCTLVDIISLTIDCINFLNKHIPEK